MKYEDDKTVKQVIIGADVTEIEKDAFDECKNLASVEFGRRKKIGQGAFFETALTEVFIPESEIGEAGTDDVGVFQGCRNLQKVVFEGNNLIVIGAYAFTYTKVETIEPKEGVTTIGKLAFDRCSNLSTLVWPTSITTVEEDVFNNCTKLHELIGSDNQDDVIQTVQLCAVRASEERSYAQRRHGLRPHSPQFLITP